MQPLASFAQPEETQSSKSTKQTYIWHLSSLILSLSPNTCPSLSPLGLSDPTYLPLLLISLQAHTHTHTHTHSLSLSLSLLLSLQTSIPLANPLSFFFFSLTLFFLLPYLYSYPTTKQSISPPETQCTSLSQNRIEIKNPPSYIYACARTNFPQHAKPSAIARKKKYKQYKNPAPNLKSTEYTAEALLLNSQGVLKISSILQSYFNSNSPPLRLLRDTTIRDRTTDIQIQPQPRPYIFPRN